MAADTVDVAIVGAGLAGLSTAAALHRVRPDARIKVGIATTAAAAGVHGGPVPSMRHHAAMPVALHPSQVYERRKAPDSLQPTRGQDSADAKDRSNSNAASEASGEEACPQGGGVRLEMNGLKAAAAISRELAADVVAKGLYANKVLLHDTLGALAALADSKEQEDACCYGLLPLLELLLEMQRPQTWLHSRLQHSTTCIPFCQAMHGPQQTLRCAACWPHYRRRCHEPPARATSPQLPVPPPARPHAGLV